GLALAADNHGGNARIGLGLGNRIDQALPDRRRKRVHRRGVRQDDQHVALLVGRKRAGGRWGAGVGHRIAPFPSPFIGRGWGGVIEDAARPLLKAVQVRWPMSDMGGKRTFCLTIRVFPVSCCSWHARAMLARTLLALLSLIAVPLVAAQNKVVVREQRSF